MKRLGIAIFALAFLLPATALAGDAARLFDEGVRLLDQGKVAEACPKLEESQLLEPAADTLLNLAGCYERSGRRALALSTFHAAAESARLRGRPDWQKLADDHVRTLTAALPTLTITPSDPHETLDVQLDGVAVREVGSAIPIDPGSHVVVAKSTGKRPYSVNVTIAKSTVVLIPALEVLPPSRAPTPSPSTKTDSGLSTQQVVGIAVGGVGVASLVFAGVSALLASSALDDAKASCPSYPNRCSRSASDPNDRAEAWSTIGTVSAIAGGALLAGGAVLFFVPFRAKSKVAFDGSQILIRGQF